MLLAGCQAREPREDEFAPSSGKANAVGNASGASAQAPRNGPFGIEAGSSLASLGAVPNTETGVAVLDTVPRPSSQFPTVAVVAFEQTGVCEVRALSSVFDSDSQLLSAQGFADQIAQAMESRYGKAKKENGCSGYACRSQYPIQHVRDGTIWYGYEWRSSQQRALPNRIKEIDLYVVHAEFNNSQVRLDYRFDNQDQCKGAGRAAQAESL
jgi:hypothetical protein